MREFKTYRAGNKVIVTTKYEGKTIRGIATCAEGDDFNFEVGQDLAQKRCEKKLYDKILNNMTLEISDLDAYMHFIQDRLAEKINRFQNVNARASMLQVDLTNLEEKLAEN